MINKNSIKTVNQSTFGPHFIKPLYDSYCFSNIPKTIKNILTGKKEKALPSDVFDNLPQNYDKVVLFFIDGFGWNIFKKNQNHPLIKKFIKEGTVSKLTSQFPSTTSTHITCINTGLTTGQSGIYEWFYYEPKIDNIIAPLLFSFAGDKERETLSKTGILPDDIYPKDTIYNQLKKESVNSYAFLHKELSNSSYTDTVFNGAEIIPYHTLTEGLINLKENLLLQKNKSYYYFYFDPIDTICHLYGTDAKQTDGEIRTFLTTIETIFFQKFPEKTLVIITADHGQTRIDPKTTFYLNVEFKNFNKYLKTNKKGQPLVPAGSCRDMFLYIKDEFVNEVTNLLKEKLLDKAEVYKIEDLIKQGFFGEEVSEFFLERVGNIVILPYYNNTVWWYEKDKFKVEKLGFHGGLTPDEMEIPLILLH